MLEECKSSSNIFALSNNRSSFCFNSESLAGQHPKEGFFDFDATILTSALFPTHQTKQQCLEPILPPDIQNRIDTLCDLALSSSPPFQLSLFESTLRFLNHPESILNSQTCSPNDVLSEIFDSSRSQLRYYSRSVEIGSDNLLTGYYGTPLLPGTQFTCKKIESQSANILNLSKPGGTVDHFKRTGSIEPLFHGLAYPGLCSNENRSVDDNGEFSTPPIPTYQLCKSKSAREHSQTPIRLEENKPVPVAKEFNQSQSSLVHSTEKIKRFPCPECGHKFARAYNLRTHIATHAGTRPFSCQVDGCYKAFSRRHDLRRHMTAVHHQ